MEWEIIPREDLLKHIDSIFSFFSNTAVPYDNIVHQRRKINFLR